MSWADGPMLAYDCETTSADPETARIVTACATMVGPTSLPAAHRELYTTQWLVNPGVDIPAEAAAIHGVTTEQAQEHGMDPAAAALAILQTLADAWSRGVPVVIMNAPYDLTVLDRELHRHCDGCLPTPGPVLDPRVIVKHLDEIVGYHRKGSRKLVDLAVHYKVKLEDAHTAEGDCIAAARVIWRMATNHPQIGQRSLRELQALQVKWHDEQCQSLQEYLDRKGQVERVDRSWPLRKVQVA